MLKQLGKKYTKINKANWIELKQKNLEHYLPNHQNYKCDFEKYVHMENIGGSINLGTEHFFFKFSALLRFKYQSSQKMNAKS